METLTDKTAVPRSDIGFLFCGKKPDFPETRLGKRFKQCVLACKYGQDAKHNIFYDLYYKLQETYPQGVALINGMDVSLEELKLERESALQSLRKEYLKEMADLLKAHIVHKQ